MNIKKEIAKVSVKPKRTSKGSGRKATSVEEKLAKIPFDLKKVQKLAAFYGTTDADLAGVLGVSETTINDWRRKYPSFSEHLKMGRDEADARVIESLYNRALGYEYDEVVYEKVLFNTKGQKNLSKTEIKKITSNDIYKTKITKKHLAADPTSMIFWLKNRRPEEWRDKHELEHSGTIEERVRNMTEEERELRLKKLSEKLKK